MRQSLQSLMVLLLWGSVVFAQTNKLVDLKETKTGRVAYAGFILNSTQTITIDAIGASDPTNDEMYAYGWILDSPTRKLVWEMTTDNTENSDRERDIREFHGTVTLPKGEYEVYFFGRTFFNMRVRNFDDAWEYILGKKWKVKKTLKNLGIKITGEGQGLSAEAVENYLEARKKQSVIQMTALGNSEYLNKGFSLEKPMKLKIYAIGEKTDNMYDYGWIQNEETGRTVWEMKESNTDHAGGAEKNVIFSKEVQFEAGNYTVHFVTDDSHSAVNWNSNPPYDPLYWGITLTGAGEDFNKKFIKDYTPKEEQVIVEIRRVRDDEFRTEKFTVKDKLNVRIFAEGEAGDEDMVDYGWIVDIKTRRTIWKMSMENTEPAGGARKNRKFEGVLTLLPGSYEVFYKTDGSHSYRDWNDAPPYDQEGWGIRITSTDKKDIEEKVQKYVETEDADLLVEIMKVQDDEHLQKTFMLPERTKIHIYALGEGVEGEMADYGWIENDDTGEQVWTMRYRQTERAGGASKNRKFDGVITLGPGTYRVHYETDGSHSFNDWNDTPPDDPYHWGITLRKVSGDYKSDYKSNRYNYNQDEE